MRATKGNKEYMIDGSQQKRYQDAGFDILNELGEVVAYGRGKTVPYDEHMRAITEIEVLRKRLADLESATNTTIDEEVHDVPEAEPPKKAGTKKASE